MKKALFKTISLGLGSLILQVGSVVFSVGRFVRYCGGAGSAVSLSGAFSFFSTAYIVIWTREAALWEHFFHNAGISGVDNDSLPSDAITSDEQIYANKKNKSSRCCYSGIKCLIVINIIPLTIFSSYLATKSVVDKGHFGKKDARIITLVLAAYVTISDLSTFALFVYREVSKNIVSFTNRIQLDVLDRRKLAMAVLLCGGGSLANVVLINFLVTNSLKNFPLLNQNSNSVKNVVSACVAATALPLSFYSSSVQAYRFFTNNDIVEIDSRLLTKKMRKFTLLHRIFILSYLFFSLIVGYISVIGMFKEMGLGSDVYSIISSIILAFSMVFSDYVFLCRNSFNTWNRFILVPRLNSLDALLSSDNESSHHNDPLAENKKLSGSSALEDYNSLSNSGIIFNSG